MDPIALLLTSNSFFLKELLNDNQLATLRQGFRENHKAKLLNKEQEDERSVATEDQSGYKSWCNKIKILFLYCQQG